MDDRPRPTIGWTKILGWALSLIALAIVGSWLWQLDRTVWSQLRQLNPGFLALSLVLLQGWFITRFLAWRLISQRHGYQSGSGENLRMWAVSEFMRYIPGNVWSFAARWRGSLTGGVSKASATQALMIEALGLVGGALLLVGLTSQLNWWWGVLMAMAAYVVLMPRLLPWITKKFRWEQPAQIASRQLFWLVLLYAGSWFLFGLAHAAVYYSFPTPPVILIVHLVAYSVLAWLLGYLSLITPMGLGVREATLAGLLRTSAGLELSFASLITITSRLWLILSELVFVTLVLLFSKKR